VSAAVCRALLIGNSRWHWAERVGKEWQMDHGPPDPTRLLGSPLVWSAVGPIPSDLPLPREQQRTLADVPLAGCPDWLGVDRALGATAAWQMSQRMGLDLHSGLLLADAGTVLSLTLLDAQGQFAGGQLMPGLQLQLNAMASGTTALQRPDQGTCPSTMFPRRTDEAMMRGAMQAMVGALREAQRTCQSCLWICGGDSDWLGPALAEGQAMVHVDPDLVMKGLVQLIDPVSPGQDR